MEAVGFPGVAPAYPPHLGQHQGSAQAVGINDNSETAASHQTFVDALHTSVNSFSLVRPVLCSSVQGSTTLFCLGWRSDWFFGGWGFFLWDWVSLCRPGCPGTCCIDHAGLDLRDLHLSAS